MNSKDNEILQEVQKQCLEDPDGLISALKKHIFKITEKNDLSLQEILRVLHSMKGNFQAAGFLHFSQWIHDWEGIILELIEKESKNKNILKEKKFLESFKLRMGNIIVSLDNYIFTLKHSLVDKPDLYENHKDSLKQLNEVFDAYMQKIPVNSQVATPKIADYGFFVEDAIENSEKPEVVTQERKIEVKSKPINEIPNSSLFEDYVICRHRKSYYAIPSFQVLEIIEEGYFNPAPFSSGSLVGFIVYRGEPLAVLRSSDLVPLSVRKKHTTMIIASVKNLIYAFEVESVESIEKIGPSRMQIPPILHALPANSWIVGVGFSEKNKVFVLDLEKALSV